MSDVRIRGLRVVETGGEDGRGKEAEKGEGEEKEEERCSGDAAATVRFGETGRSSLALREGQEFIWYAMRMGA